MLQHFTVWIILIFCIIMQTSLTKVLALYWWKQWDTIWVFYGSLPQPAWAHTSAQNKLKLTTKTMKNKLNLQILTIYVNIWPTFLKRFFFFLTSFPDWQLLQSELGSRCIQVTSNEHPDAAMWQVSGSDYPWHHFQNSSIPGELILET